MVKRKAKVQIRVDSKKILGLEKYFDMKEKFLAHKKLTILKESQRMKKKKI